MVSRDDEIMFDIFAHHVSRQLVRYILAFQPTRVKLDPFRYLCLLRYYGYEIRAQILAGHIMYLMGVPILGGEEVERLLDQMEAERQVFYRIANSAYARFDSRCYTNVPIHYALSRV